MQIACNIVPYDILEEAFKEKILKNHTKLPDTKIPSLTEIYALFIHKYYFSLNFDSKKFIIKPYHIFKK